MQRIIGTGLWFGTDKQSFGFIQYNGNCEVFCHFKQIGEKNLRDNKFKEFKKGDLLEFEIGDGFCHTGTQALNVEIVKQYEN